MAGKGGLRISQAHSAFEGLLWAIIGQQINFTFACILKSRLAKFAGAPMPEAGGLHAAGLYAPPTPAALAALEPKDLLPLQFSRQKSDYLISAARSSPPGSSTSKRSAQMSATRAERTLLELRGLGPWSVNYVMMRALGFADCVPLGDTGVTSGLQSLFKLEERPDIDATRRLMAVFSPWRSLATRPHLAIRKPQYRSNDEARKNDPALREPNDENHLVRSHVALRASDFVILSDFVIRASSFYNPMKHTYNTFPTPLGDFSIVLDEKGAVTATAFGGIATLKSWQPALQATRDPSALREAREQMLAYFAGKLRKFTLPLAPAGTEFQLNVWAALRRIPYGATRSYGEIAEELGNPKASRAVGRANGTNPICVIVPCHRVIGADGSLTGFAYGEELKRLLLEHEGALLKI